MRLQRLEAGYRALGRDFYVWEEDARELQAWARELEAAETAAARAALRSPPNPDGDPPRASASRRKPRAPSGGA